MRISRPRGANPGHVVVVLLLLIAAMTMRPTLLGEVATPLAIVASLAAFAYVAAFLNAQIDGSLFRRNLLVTLAVLVLWGYLAIHSLILGASHVDFLVKGLVTFIATMAAFCCALSVRKLHDMFFRGLVLVFLFSTLSYVVTTVLSFVTGLDALILLHVQTGYEERAGQLYFPFTTAYGTYAVGDVRVARFPGPFREAGIFQAFLVWSLFSLPLVRLDSWVIRSVLLLGLVATFSTAGIATLFAGTILYFALVRWPETPRFSGRLMLGVKSVGILALAGGAAIYAPIFGLLDKLQYAEVSVSDRLNATVAGLRGFANHPLGIGLYNGSTEHIGINLLSGLYMVGLMGIVLIASLGIVSVFTQPDWRARRMHLVLIFPFALTGLVSQPFIESPLVFIMLLQWGLLTYRPTKHSVINAMTSELHG